MRDCGCWCARWGRDLRDRPRSGLSCLLLGTTGFVMHKKRVYKGIKPPRVHVRTSSQVAAESGMRRHEGGGRREVGGQHFGEERRQLSEDRKKRDSESKWVCRPMGDKEARWPIGARNSLKEPMRIRVYVKRRERYFLVYRISTQLLELHRNSGYYHDAPLQQKDINQSP